MVPHLPFFGIFIIFTAWTSYEIKKSRSMNSKQSEEFWTRENEVNNVRRKPVDNLDYIVIPDKLLSSISTDNNDIKNSITQLKSMSNSKILNLTGVTNTDLKAMYGPANLNYLSECDDNFTLLCRTLNTLGRQLAENGYVEHAIGVYEFAVSSGSDVCASYDSLASLYIDNKMFDKLTPLLDYANKLNSLSKNTIISHINTYIESSHN